MRPTDEAVSPFTPAGLFASAIEGGLFGGAWGALGLLRSRARDAGPELVWRFAAAGALVFVLRYLVKDVSSRSTAWYYAVWILATGFAFSAVMLSRIVSEDGGVPGLVLVFSFTALGGAVFGWMYRRWHE